MPRKTKGTRPCILKGESNPRHFIMIPVGTGNQYCRNCSHLATALDTPACRVFKESLKINQRLGPERCAACRLAEKELYDAKQMAKSEGQAIAAADINSNLISRSTLLNAVV